MLGATVEFSKMEGLTFDPERNQMFLAMSTIGHGMEDFAVKGVTSSTYDQPASVTGNDIRLPYNDCGCGVVQCIYFCVCKILHSFLVVEMHRSSGDVTMLKRAEQWMHCSQKPSI
jgi:hypothetical protein